MEANPDERWLALWETNRGCPFSCTFCDWGSATAGQGLPVRHATRLLAEVDWFAEQQIEFVFCCDANFGMLKRDVDIAQHVAESRTQTGYPQALSVQNTKNATERAYQVQKAPRRRRPEQGRGALAADRRSRRPSRRSSAQNISLGILRGTAAPLHPRQGRDLFRSDPGPAGARPTIRFAEGVSRVIENGQHNRIQFNNLSILPNAEMGDPEYQQNYGMETVAVEDHQHPRLAAHSDDDVPGISGAGDRDRHDAAARLAADARLLLDDGPAAFRQGLADSAGAGSRAGGDSLSRPARSVQRRRPRRFIRHSASSAISSTTRRATSRRAARNIAAPSSG